jgi:fibronectin-binding autotransporter adhesin
VSSVVGGGGGGPTLAIQAHGEVTGEDAAIGVDDGSTGAVTVTGEQAKWTNVGVVTVGQRGVATLSVAEGGVVTSGGGVIGGDFASHDPLNPTPLPSVTVTGPGSQWNNAAGLDVGAKRASTLSILDGGRVTDVDGRIAVLLEPSEVASVTVDGYGSRWENTGELSVGVLGTGTLTLSNQATVTARTATIGADAGGISPSSITVTGGGTLFDVQTGLTIGKVGPAALNVQDVGRVGVGGALLVGGIGQGTLNIETAGSVSSASGQIGQDGGPGGYASVRNAGRWDVSGTLTVGSS